MGKVYWVNPQKIDLCDFLNFLGFKNILVLGGTTTYSWFIKKNLLDDWYITIEPVLFGVGKPLLNVKKIESHLLILKNARRVGSAGTLFLHYKNRVSR